MPKPVYDNPWPKALAIPQEWAILAGLVSVRQIDTGSFRKPGPKRDDVVTMRRVAEHYRNMARTMDRPIDYYILPQPSGDHIIGYRFGNDGPDYGTVYTDAAVAGPVLEAILRLAQALKE